VDWQVYHEQRTIFQETKEKQGKLSEQFNSLSAAHNPLKRQLTDATRNSQALSQEITKTVWLIN